MMASTLKELGINTNTIPVLDLPTNEESGIIGDRAYSTDENIVSAAGKIVIKTLTSNGVAPIMKHIPGHGKAKVDSHLEMPLVDADEMLLERYDFKPFTENTEAQLAMTAHIKFNKIDSDNIATFSKTIINKIIRQHMKFKGLLMTDDLSMKAVDCEPVNAAVKSLDAGCDLVLHCNGNINEMNMIAERIKEEFKPITIPSAIEDIYNQPVSMHMHKVESEFEYLLSQA
jgi:Beta-glucosidase-related glycosidases